LIEDFLLIGTKQKITPRRKMKQRCTRWQTIQHCTQTKK